MKLGLLEYLRCPECRSILHLSNSTVQSNEVVQGDLVCQGCGQRYQVEDGVPWFCEREPDATANKTSRTAESFGYLWERSGIGHEPYDARAYHYSRMEAALKLPSLRGLVLDAGCGDGIDLANHARRPDVEIVGVDISPGGVRTSVRRTIDLPNAHVVQADLSRLPFDTGLFDSSYSYGVLHHLDSPEAGLAEIVRVTRSGGQVAVYLYEDFSERRFFWRWLLWLANLSRGVTTRVPHGLLFRLCQLAAPVVYLLFTIPSRLLTRTSMLAPIGASFPFRHGTSPFSLTGDLYDRFSAPVERRYGRQGALDFLRTAGLGRLSIAFERGWMVTGVKTADGR